MRIVVSHAMSLDVKELKWWEIWASRPGTEWITLDSLNVDFGEDDSRQILGGRWGEH